MISVYGESHSFRPVSQKETHKRERNGEDKKRKCKKCEWPTSKGNQVLEERHEDEWAESDTDAGQTIGHSPLFVEPVGEDDCEGGDAETGDTHSCNHTEKEVKLDKGFDLGAEEEPQTHQKDSWKDDLSRTHAIDEVTNHGSHCHIDQHPDGLGSCSLCATPTEMVDQSNEENGEGGSEGVPECHGNHGQAHDHPAIVKSPLHKSHQPFHDRKKFNGFRPKRSRSKNKSLDLPSLFC